MSSPDPDIPPIENRKHHSRVEQLHKGLIRVIRRTVDCQLCLFNLHPNLHSHHAHSIRDRPRTSIRTINLRRERQLPPIFIPSRSLQQRIRRLPSQRPTRLHLHLDATQQIRYRLPGQQLRIPTAIVALRKGQGGVKGCAHDANAHGTDQDGGAIEAGAHDRSAGTRRAKQVLGWYTQVGVFDVWAGAGRVRRGRDVAKDAEGVGIVAFDIICGHEKYHDRIAGFIRFGGCCAAYDALEVGATKVPASTVGSPDLGVIS